MSSCFIRGFAWILAVALIVKASSDASQAGGFCANDTSLPSTTHAVVASRATAPNNPDPASNAPVVVKLDSEPKGRAAATKSGFLLFNEKTETLFVEGLQNRTTLVLVSRRGAHARLIWERPAAKSGKPEKKANPGPAVLWSQDLSQYLEPEVLAMKGRPAEGAKGVVFGDRSGDGKAVEMTAFLVAGIMPAGDAHRQRLFTSKVTRLAKQLLNHFGDIQFQIVAYPPLETVDINRAPWGVNDIFKSTPKASPGGGKLVLEYQPAKSRGEKASWRLNIDEADVNSGNASWDPTEVQVARAPEKQVRWLSGSSFSFSAVATTLPPSSRQTSSLGTPSLRKKWVADNKAPVTIDRNNRFKDLSAVAASSTAPSKPPPPPALYKPHTPPPRAPPLSKRSPPPLPKSKPPPSLLDGKPPPPPPSKTFFKSGKTPPPEPDEKKGAPTSSAPQGPPTGPFVTDMRNLSTRKRSSKEDKDLEPTTLLTTLIVTVKPNQVSTTTGPARVVYYTPTPEPPKRPSSDQAPPSDPQGPEPSEAAYIYFEWNEYTDFWEGDKKPSAQWQMLPRKLDKMYHIVCRVTPVGGVLATVKEPTRSPGRPASFSAVADIWGRHNCKYKSGRAEGDPGKLSCDGVPEFDCYADPQEGEGINCSTEPGHDRYYIPRVRCEFPAGKKTRNSHSDKNNNGGWRPIPGDWGVWDSAGSRVLDRIT